MKYVDLSKLLSKFIVFSVKELKLLDENIVNIKWIYG